MNCRYTRVLAECTKAAAEWQTTFTSHVTNTFPNIYQYVLHPGDAANVIEITGCDKFLPGFRDIIAFFNQSVAHSFTEGGVLT